MVATVAIPFESLPVKRRKLQSEQQKRRIQESASPPSSDDEEIVVTVEEEEEEREHPRRRCHGRPLPPSKDELPLDLSSKKSASSVKLFQPTLPANAIVRRMVANARERCRVHMISEAFEALRVALPSACPAQKLTKVSILRIACDYIMLLGAMNGRDYSADQRSPSVDELRRQLSETILAETNFKCV
ncbi:hypothetical protein D918_08892 [Trichuris suis]|nr:hypothetical protein D918_08892 [Trichuris suis]